MKKSVRILLAALAVYLLLLILLLSAEARSPDASIHTLWDAVWFSLITMTTVGYGDLSPVTPAGRVLGLIFALCSIGSLTALISLGIQLISGQFLPRMRLQMNRKQKWYVFNEQTPEALTLAARLKAAEPHSLFLFPQAAESTEKDASFVLMDAGCEALTALRGSSDGMVFFGMSGDCWKNYEQGLDAAEKGIPAYCMTDFSVDRLPAEMHLFSLRDVLSRSYWKTHPLRSDENQIVLIGSGSAGSALLERALLTNVFEPGRRVTYHVFGNPDDFAELHPAIVRALVPEGDDDILHLYSGSWSEQRELLQTADRILLCADSEQEPAWTITASSMSASSTSSAFRSMSAPGLRAKVKRRSPSSASVTKAMVVMASLQSSGVAAFTPYSARVSIRKRPKSSSPTLQAMEAFSPFLDTAMATLAGAPPALRI